MKYNFNKIALNFFGALLALLVLGVVFKIRTFFVLFEMLAAVTALVLGTLTVYSLYMWYKNNRPKKDLFTPKEEPIKDLSVKETKNQKTKN